MRAPIKSIEAQIARYGRDAIAARLAAVVAQRGPDDCWNFSARPGRSGYGCIKLSGTAFRAHRIAWAIANGDPGALHVCHKCDNRLCCNPAHMFLGTNADNVADKVRKGRVRTTPRRGESSNFNKYPRELIEAVIADKRQSRVIAAETGLSSRYVRQLQRGYRWGPSNSHSDRSVSK